MDYQSIKVNPLTGALGAEIAGVDLSKKLTNQQQEEVHRAFLDFQVIYFRDQTLNAEQQVSMARLFGNPITYPYLSGVDGVPEAHEIVKTPDDEVNFGGVWHSDTSYKPKPDMGTVLFAVEVPEAGGDTLFANTYLAYNALSNGMKAVVEDLIGINDSEKLYPGGRANRISKLSKMKDSYTDGSQPMQSEHPIVRTHPETGQKGLYVSEAHTLSFKDMTVEESKPLIAFLGEHISRPEFTCRLRWQKNTLAVWDNRCTQHFAVNDYRNSYRHMRRVTLQGEVPV
ncbi:MAG: hypothetical protein CBB68_14115 [Rhodospirillaceae bacterium TMED8]|nr:taurine dioxygenase [Magnetovibrio sp.]OUT48149.1 MAG: hypothetical protein CBB68_14115 [Rhodospirillaceae bacterium TMED8]